MIDKFYFREAVRRAVKKGESKTFSPTKIRNNSLKRYFGEKPEIFEVNEVEVDQKGRVQFSNGFRYITIEDILPDDLEKLLKAIGGK